MTASYLSQGLNHNVMKIHSLYILNESGACIYQRLFTEKFKEIPTDLVTPFFSAILSFSEKLISRKIEVLEFADLRFVFRPRDDFIFILLAYSTENLLFLNSVLEKISTVFLEKVKELNWVIDEVLINQELDVLIDQLICGEQEVLKFKSNPGYVKVLDLMGDLITEGEIIGAAILSEKGIIIYSSLSDDVLGRSMRELEIRYQTRSFDVPEHFYILKNGQKVSEKIIQCEDSSDFLLIVQFPSSAQLGMVDFTTENIVESIKDNYC